MTNRHSADPTVGKGDAGFSGLAPQRRRSPLRGPVLHLRHILLGAGLSALFSLSPLPAQSSGEIPAGRGHASWYGGAFSGKKTASGEIFNHSALTAAHKELPFGTVLRVYNLKNGRHVLVRVNDRGPFVDGRIVDLSKRAAEGLNMTTAGVVPVVVNVIGDNKGVPLNGDNGFYVQVADEPSALKVWHIAAMLEKKVNRPMRILSSFQGGAASLALCLGPYKNFAQAQRDFLKLEQKQVKALGIIEAPAKGGSLPHRDPPRRKTASAKRNPGDGKNTPRAFVPEFFPRQNFPYGLRALFAGKCSGDAGHRRADLPVAPLLQKKDDAAGSFSAGGSRLPEGTGCEGQRRRLLFRYPAFFAMARNSLLFGLIGPEKLADTVLSWYGFSRNAVFFTSFPRWGASVQRFAGRAGRG